MVTALSGPVLPEPERFGLSLFDGQDVDHAKDRGFYCPGNPFEIDRPPLADDRYFITGLDIDRMVCTSVHAGLDHSCDPESHPVLGELYFFHPDTQPHWPFLHLFGTNLIGC